MSYERKLMLRHSLASIVALAIFGASRFVYSVVISRKFGIEILGRANSLISQAFLLAIPLSFFAVALGKYTSEFLAKAEKEKIKSITTIGFAFPFVGVCLIPFNLFLGVIALLRAFQLTFRSFIYGLHRGEVYAYVMCVSFLFFIGGFLFENYYTPYIGLLLVITISGFIYLFKNKLLGKPKFEDFKLLTRYSSFAFLGTLSGVFLVQAPYFLSEKFAGSIVAGIVSASLSSAFLLTYLPQVFQSAIMPLYSYKYGKNEMNYVRWLAEESTKMLSLFVAFIVFILILVGRDLLSVLFGFTLGNEFYLALMAVETYIAYNPSIVALNSTQYVREGTFVAIFGAIISLVSWLTLIKPFEEYGAVLGLLLGYLAILLMTAWISYKNIGISPRSYFPFVLAVSVQGLIFISKSLFFIGFLVYLLGVKEEVKKALELFRAYI